MVGNTRGDPSINLLIITVMVICMFAYLSMVGGVYKQWHLNFIEIVFLSNLGILSVSTLFAINFNSSAMPVTYASVSVAFATFIIISAYHVIIKLNQSRSGKLLVSFIRENSDMYELKR